MRNTFSIYLLRHGELSQKNVLAGKTDFMLSNTGLSQLKTATELLNIDKVISSPRFRCSLFAKEYAQHHRLPFEVADEIAEMDFGDWDGVSYDELWQQDKPNIGDFWQSPFNVTPPNGESFLKFSTRVENWWLSLLNSDLSANTLVVSHAGVIKCLMALVCGNQIGSLEFERFVTTVAVGYGRMVHIQVYKETGYPASVQVML